MGPDDQPHPGGVGCVGAPGEPLMSNRMLMPDQPPAWLLMALAATVVAVVTVVDWWCSSADSSAGDNQIIRQLCAGGWWLGPCGCWPGTLYVPGPGARRLM